MPSSPQVHQHECKSVNCLLCSPKKSTFDTDWKNEDMQNELNLVSPPPDSVRFTPMSVLHYEESTDNPSVFLQASRPPPSPFRKSPKNTTSTNRFKAPITDDDDEDDELQILPGYDHYGKVDEEYAGLNTHGSFFDGKIPQPAASTTTISRPILEEKTPDSASEMLKEWEKRRQEAIHKSVEDRVKNITDSMKTLHVQATTALDTLQQRTRTYVQQEQGKLLTKYKKHQEAKEKMLQIMSQVQQQQHSESERRLREFAAVKEKEAEELRKKQQEELKKSQDAAAAQKLKEEQEQKRKQAEELAAKQKEEKPTTTPTVVSPPVTTTATTPTPSTTTGTTGGKYDHVPESMRKAYEERMKVYYDAQAKIKPLMDSPNFPDIKRRFFPRINLNISQISADRTQIIKKIDILSDIIRESSQDPIVYTYCLDLAAMKFIEQGTMQIAAHRDSCYSFANVVVALMAKYPDFVPIMLAHFHKSCPYTVPCYIPRFPGKSDGEWLTDLGYKKKSGATDANDAASYETEETYTDRMAGILSLYAAVTQIDFPGGHPHGIANAWSWVARMLNLKPKRITAQLVLSFLQVAGFRLLQVYNRQFRKVLALIKEEVLPKLPQESLASATRLQLFLMDYEQAGGVIAKPKGLI